MLCHCTRLVADLNNLKENILKALGIPLFMRMGMKNVFPKLTFWITEDRFEMVAKTQFRTVNQSLPFDIETEVC